MQDGLRKQGQEPIRSALRCGLEFNDLAIVAAGDDEIDLLGGDGMLLIDTPAVLAEEVGDKVFKLAFDSRAGEIRAGKRGGRDFTLALLKKKSRPDQSPSVKAPDKAAAFPL